MNVNLKHYMLFENNFGLDNRILVSLIFLCIYLSKEVKTGTGTKSAHLL